MPVADIVRKFAVGKATFYRWKKKFGGMGVAELRRLRQLEKENQKLKSLVADLSPDKKMLQDVMAMRCRTPRRHSNSPPRQTRSSGPARKGR